MTYLETPLFGNSHLVNNKQLHTLITIPKKYEKINDYIRIFVAIILLPIIINIFYMEDIKSHVLTGLLIKMLFISSIPLFQISHELMKKNNNKNIIIKTMEDIVIKTIMRLVPLLIFGIAIYYVIRKDLNKDVKKYVNPLVLFNIVFLLICAFSYYTKILSEVFYMTLLLVLLVNLYNGHWKKFLLMLLVLLIQLIIRLNIFETSKIYDNFTSFIEEEITSNSEYLIESRLLLITYNEYLNYAKDNNIKVEKDIQLCKDKEFLKFLQEVYLKNKNESTENKKFVEDYLNNINNNRNISDIIESKAIVLSNVLNKYIIYSEKNKLKVELVDNNPFLKFLREIYLKDDSEPKENKKIIEDFLSHINNKTYTKEERKV